MKRLQLHPEAETELAEAAAYYEAQQTGLGTRFLDAIEDAFERTRNNPLLYRVVETDVHRCLVRIFPYGVLFRIRPEVIVVVAIMHLHRGPGYWKGRTAD
jgi:toxin ParE1/3/4